MTSHNAKAELAFHDASAGAIKENSEAPGQRLPPAIDSNLTVDEDFDLGCDPYNATGQHVIMKSKIAKDD